MGFPLLSAKSAIRGVPIVFTVATVSTAESYGGILPQ
jgi:hypothetical protein